MATSRKIQVTCRDAGGDTFTAFNGNWGQIFTNDSLQAHSRSFMSNVISPLVDGDIISSRVTTADVYYPSAGSDTPEP